MIMKEEDKDMHQVNGVAGFTGSIIFKKQKFILTGAYQWVPLLARHSALLLVSQLNHPLGSQKNECRKM